MQVPITVGTILQNRYRLISILGQGGFCRTYLAEDTGRFNELCALKEFIPQQTNVNTVAKSQELFSREAAILYKIQHPQIPKFRATFEEHQRLFLLQDYVEGKTYRTILQERQVTNSLFSEVEVLTFLRQMLSVLAYIHNLGIIHRDISPENIIRRETDQIPVLIDFGVVKEIATKVQSPDLAKPLTSVGKFCYAPWEQIQLGRATANSDLYALAVTTVVLLTGKEPQELINQAKLTWNWQQWVVVSPGFAEIINKMLSRQPSDRYQSVTEVEKALAILPRVKSQQLLTINQQLNNFSASQEATVGANINQNPSTNNGFFDNYKWSTTALMAVLILLSGIASWSGVNFILKRRQQQPQLQESTEINPILVPTIPTLAPTTSSPIPSLSPSPTPKSIRSFPTPVIPAASPRPKTTITPLSTPSSIYETPAITPPTLVTSEERLNVLPDRPISIEGKLKGNEIIKYIIFGSQGQNLNLFVTGKGVLMSILTENEALIDEVSEQVSIWKGKLPKDGDYKIILTPLPNLSGTDYKLDINLINPIPKFTPTSEPRVIDSPAPTSELEAIDLPTPASEAEAIDLPTPASEPQGKEFPASVPLNKPAKEQIATPAPIPLNKPVNKQIVTPAPGATPLKKFNKSSKKEAVGPEATKTE